nr:MAG TPA: hypothetical protein [Caudoviricetes sp.]
MTSGCKLINSLKNSHFRDIIKYLYGSVRGGRCADGCFL